MKGSRKWRNVGQPNEQRILNAFHRFHQIMRCRTQGDGKSKVVCVFNQVPIMKMYWGSEEYSSAH